MVKPSITSSGTQNARTAGFRDIVPAFPLNLFPRNKLNNMVTKTREERTSFLNQNIISYATIKVVGQDIMFNLQETYN